MAAHRRTYGMLGASAAPHALNQRQHWNTLSLRFSTCFIRTANDLSVERRSAVYQTLRCVDQQAGALTKAASLKHDSCERSTKQGRGAQHFSRDITETRHVQGVLEDRTHARPR